MAKNAGACSIRRVRAFIRQRRNREKISAKDTRNKTAKQDEISDIGRSEKAVAIQTPTRRKLSLEVLMERFRLRPIDSIDATLYSRPDSCLRYSGCSTSTAKT